MGLVAPREYINAVTASQKAILDKLSPPIGNWSHSNRLYMFYITLIQIALIAFKLTETLIYSWWLILSPLIAINIISFCIAFKREYIKAKNQ